MQKKWLFLLMVTLVTFSASVYAGGQAEGASNAEYEIVMVAKHEGIAWFDDMRDGVEAFSEAFPDVHAYQIAPEGGDAARQVQMVEDLIAADVDAILVVPNDPGAMEPVLRRAKDAGIVVISHEAPQLAGIVDYDLEAFVNEEFGRLMFEELAKSMDYQGKFAGIVGGLTMQTHMQWFEAGLAHVEANYPDMEFVLSEPIEDSNTEQVAYDRARETLNAHPDLEGLFSCSVSGTVMQALAVDERGLQDQVSVAGLSLPSMSGDYLESGALDHAQAWRPADAGYAAAALAYRLLTGQPVEDGIDLGAPGYESVVLDGGVVYGDAPLVITRDNYADLPF